MDDLTPATAARLADYLAGNLPPDDARAAEQWIAERPGRKAFVDALVGTRGRMAPERDMAVAGQTDALIQHLHGQVTGGVVETVPVRRLAVRVADTSRSWRSLWYSSAIAAVAVFGILSWTYLQRAVPDITGERHEYTTVSAQRAVIDLPDGSSVVLAPESHLVYTAAANGARHVTLNGQAFFSVMPDAQRSFTVKTGAVTTQVLGTAFDVQNYLASTMTHVTVMSGKVSVQNTRTSLIVTPGVIASVTDSTTRTELVPNTQPEPAWTRGRLVFRATPVAEVLQSVSRWSGYKFRIADSALIREPMSAELDLNNLSGTLNSLKVLLDVHMTFEGNVITLRARQGNRPGLRGTGREAKPVFSNQSGVGK